MPTSDLLLLRVLRAPATVASATVDDWMSLLAQARRAGILGRVAARLERAGVLPRVPADVATHLRAERLLAAEHQRALRWEVNRIERALHGVPVPLVLLKGAAYAVAGLPVAEGRVSADVDILVPRAAVGGVEEALERHGWEPVVLDAYDQRYYRRWMHELPPLRHGARRAVVDVHHAILPLTSRLRPTPDTLLSEAVAVPGWRARILAPADMVLHAAVHLFHDGDLRHAIRELLDLDELLRHFGGVTGFWEHLARRAANLGLARPLHYAFRYAGRFLDTPLAAASETSGGGRPSRAVQAAMDRLVAAAVRADAAGVSRQAWAPWLLYVRSHWLRMPPWLLAPHLARKAARLRPA